MIEKIKLPFFFDPQKLKEELKNIKDEDWFDHFNKSDYDGDWKGVPLRGPAGAVHPILKLAPHPGIKDYSDYELLDECPYIKEVVDTFDCPKMCVRLLNLKAGSVIKEHRDLDLNFEDGEARIHVPIQTNSNVIFKLRGERVIMNEGETWYMNFSLPHSIINNGKEDRIHLVIDCKVNDWITNLFLNPVEAN